jgi:hypothetical protein
MRSAACFATIGIAGLQGFVRNQERPHPDRDSRDVRGELHQEQGPV